MSDPEEELTALRCAYYDIYAAVEPFVATDCFSSTLDITGDLNTRKAREATAKLFEELYEDGYTKREVSFLSALAVHNATEDQRLGEMLREERDSHDET